MTSYNRDDILLLEKQVCDCLKFIDSFRWLLDAYVVEFFVEAHWEKLPDDWKSALDIADSSNLACLLNFFNDTDDVCLKSEGTLDWPVSLISFLESIRTLSIDRKPIDFKHENEAELSEIQKRLSHIFRKNVKPKKQHEIDRLSQSIFNVCQKVDSKCILDVGGGQGHLARRLSYGYGLRVATLDGQEEFIDRAKGLDIEATKFKNKIASKQCSKVVDYNNLTESCLEANKEPVHLHLNISTDIEASVFCSVLDSTWPSLVEEAINEPVVLVGLHTCGDLGPTMLRLTVECSRLAAIVSVPCCYMKMTPNSLCYPLSESLRGLSNANLSYEALEVACHAVEMYANKLKDPGSWNALRVHCFRAVLEHCIVSKYPDMKRAQLRSVKHQDAMTFSEYASRALERFSKPLTVVEDDAVRDMLKQWKRVVAFFTLRTALSKVVETVLILDRVIYLLENDFQVQLLPLFDPSLSPRNIVIVGEKHC